MHTFESLRELHKEFIYHSCEITEDGFSFHFSIDDFHFRPFWKCEKGLLCNPTEFTKYVIFNIGMAELVSYWKCACPKKVTVKAGTLTKEQCAWWKKLYFNGLGEFFYKNNITTDLDSFMEIIPEKSDMPALKSEKHHDGFLVPIGGGKDSIVTIELLPPYKEKTQCYIINPRGATLGCANTAGFGEDAIVGVRRTIDKELLNRNADGYLNGHTPFSAVVAFSSYLFAYLKGLKYIALSNESSANESNVQGTNINHQYSKSTEFERDFRNYVAQYLDDSIQYFSMLRCWSEWQIAKKFVQYPKYFSVFQSCNLGSKTDTWCGKCAKCLYVYILLSAFLDDDTLIGIFGLDMLDVADFRPMFEGLIYEDVDKPFECVGTKEEIRLALYTAAQQRGENLPLLLREYMDKNPEKPATLDNYYDRDNFIPEELKPLLKI